MTYLSMSEWLALPITC